MKTKIMLAALAAAAASIPGVAQAQETSGVHPYIGAQVGFHDLGIDRDSVPPLTLDDNGIIYGGYVGVDFDVSPNVVVGAEGNFNLGTSAIDSDYGVAGRIGYRTDNGTIIYARAGYQWINLDVAKFTGVANPPAVADTVDDYLVGIGADIATGGKLRLRVGVDTVSFDTIRPTVGANIAF